MSRSEGRKSAHVVRIIGGQWRGRRLPVAAVAGLRPTPDRVRETLFNWLAPALAGARCLDLFAGTGALGFEALSRGAAHVVFVERDPRAAARLRESAALLGADCRVVNGSAQGFLAESDEPFDLVFLDPPYDVDPDPLCKALRGRLAPRGLVYVERGRAADLAALESWGSLRKRARAGAVHFGLLALAEAGSAEEPGSCC